MDSIQACVTGKRNRAGNNDLVEDDESNDESDETDKGGKNAETNKGDAAASKRERPQLTLRPDGLYPDWFLSEQHYHCCPKTLDRRRKRGVIPQPDVYHGNVRLTRGSTILDADDRAARAAAAARQGTVEAPT